MTTAQLDVDVVRPVAVTEDGFFVIARLNDYALASPSMRVAISKGEFTRRPSTTLLCSGVIRAEMARHDLRHAYRMIRCGNGRRGDGLSPFLARAVVERMLRAGRAVEVVR